MVFTPLEIINILITIIVIGLIFSRSFETNEILYWIQIAGISIILHEIAHKIVALLLGYPAVYNVWIFGLLIGLLLKLIGSPVIFFVPGFVEVLGPIHPLHMSLIAISGPLMNLLLYFIGKYKSEDLKRLNLWLFMLNMIPIPPLDGGKFILGIISYLM